MKRVDRYRIHVDKTERMLVDATVYANETIRVEDDALKQLKNAASIDEDSAVFGMPDIHTGYGVPIGCVFASQNFVSPSAVGYDINCGMRLLTTPLQANDINVRQLADSIRRDVPLGEGKSNVELSPADLESVLSGGVRVMPDLVAHSARLAQVFNKDDFDGDLVSIEDEGSMDGGVNAVSDRAKARGRRQFGTLGGGNHFIELQRVETVFDRKLAEAFGVFEGQFVVMLHSGSRGLGHQVGGDYMKKALQFDKAENWPVLDPQLAYFPISSGPGKGYLKAMCAAANFAFVNRQVMAMLVRKDIRHYCGRDLALPSLYDVAHNIAKLEVHYGNEYCVHRKGSTRAFDGARMKGTRFEETGQPILIPGSMGTASYLLSGVASGKESFCSVNHGAGRVMSRTRAAGKVTRKGKRIKEAAITDEEFDRSMEGVYLVCEDRRTIKEEAPAAYKDIDQIIETIAGAGLAARVARMRPLAVLKG